MGQWSKAGQGREERQTYERVDVKSEVARTLIEAMEQGNAPWQKPWNAQAMTPINPITGNGYKGVNRLLLSMAARSDGHGRLDSRFMTYKQAEAWAIRCARASAARQSSRLSPSIGSRVQALGAANQGSGGGSSGGQDGGQGGETDLEQRASALRRYVVFNAQQIDGVPELDCAPTETPFNTVERAEAVIEAMKEKTGLLVIHGAKRPATSHPWMRCACPRKAAGFGAASTTTLRQHFTKYHTAPFMNRG